MFSKDFSPNISLIIYSQKTVNVALRKAVMYWLIHKNGKNDNSIYLYLQVWVRVAKIPTK